MKLHFKIFLIKTLQIPSELSLFLPPEATMYWSSEWNWARGVDEKKIQFRISRING